MNATALAFQLLLLSLAGYLVMRFKVVPQDFDKSVTAFVMNVALPCLVVKVISTSNLRQYGAEAASGFLTMFIVLCALYGAGLLAGRFVKGPMRVIFAFVAAFPNFTFFGMPAAEAVYGEEGLFWFTLLTVVPRILLYSMSPVLVGGSFPKGVSFGKKLKAFFTPVMSGLAIGLFLTLAEIPLPQPVFNAVSAFSGCCTPLGMAICGMTAAKMPAREYLKPRFLRLPLVCNILAPAAALAAVLLMKTSAQMASLCIVYAACPMGVTAVNYVRTYRQDTDAVEETSAGLLLSTLLSIVTVPLWMMLTARIFP